MPVEEQWENRSTGAVYMRIEDPRYNRNHPYPPPPAVVENHLPTRERLIADGYYLRVSPVCDCDTHKTTSDDMWDEDSKTVCCCVVELPPEEQPPVLARMVNEKYTTLTKAYEAEDKSIFAGFVHAQQKTFYLQEREAIAWTANNSAPTEFLDGIISHGTRTDKAEIVSTILAEAAILKPIVGANYEKYRSLINLLAEVDIAGDYATEKAKLDAISW